MSYILPHISGKPQWDAIPSVSICHPLWSNVPEIVPSAQAAWDEDALYVRLQALEPHILRRFTGIYDSVCDDSCLEFFFCPEGNTRYFNFEANPNGALYVGYGQAAPARTRLIRQNFGEIFGVQTFDIPGGWGVELRIPVSFIRIFVPEFTLEAGKTLQANFYKCGDETVKPHYFAWNPVDLPEPNFHRPDFFGTITLGNKM